jgi:hypothetical protein
MPRTVGRKTQRALGILARAVDRAGFEPRPLICFLPNVVRVGRTGSQRFAKPIGQTLDENQSRVAAQKRRGYTKVIGKLAARRVFRPSAFGIRTPSTLRCLR